jgi:Zn-dependent protease
MDFASLERIALAAVPIILAITVHEAAHGYVARIFGDSTAWMLGRVTLNPFKHIDPIGTVVVPLATLCWAASCSAGRSRCR